MRCGDPMKVHAMGRCMLSRGLTNKESWAFTGYQGLSSDIMGYHRILIMNFQHCLAQDYETSYFPSYLCILYYDSSAKSKYYMENSWVHLPISSNMHA